MLFEKKPEYKPVQYTPQIPDVKVGDVAIVPGQMWVHVENTTPVKSGNGEFRSGDKCIIAYEGIMEVVAVRDQKTVLARYRTNSPSYGTKAPQGVMFLISKVRFSQMTKSYHKVCRLKAENAALVDQVA